MPGQENIQNEEPRTLTLEERWQMDEEMQKDGVSNYQVFTPQCESCRFAKEDTRETCQKYQNIPWEIMTVQIRCPHYRRSKEHKPQLTYMSIGDRAEILEYKFLPEEALRQISKYPALAVWAYDESNPVCSAVFTQESDGEGILVVLQYICTLEEYQNLGAAAELMQYAQKLFADAGVKRLAAFTEQEEMASFFQAIDWKQESCDWQNLEYLPKRVMTEQLKPFTEGTVDGIFSLSPEVRRLILSEDQSIPPELKACLCDDGISDNSLVYVPDRKIEGAVILEKRDGYQMCIRYLYISPDCREKTILLRLLAKVFANRKNWSGKGTVLICARENRIGKLAEYLFGESDTRIEKRMYRNGN